MKDNYLTLKWGTIKSCNFAGNPKAEKLLEKYIKLGCCESVMFQKNTDEQKEIVCQLIDSVPGKIYLEWDSRYVSKKEAKKYVLEYK
jgi:hypothetical protein